ETSPRRLAGWLGIYNALGIPVIGEDGKAVGSTGDDPIGPRFWQVWYASRLDVPRRGIPLSDAGRLISAGIPHLDGSSLGRVLLSDIRLAARSNDPKQRLFGRLIREPILRG